MKMDVPSPVQDSSNITSIALHTPSPSIAGLNVRKSTLDTLILAQGYIINELPQQALLARYVQKSKAQPYLSL